MGKRTSNGPDWTDVATMMSALGSLHGSPVGMLITAAIQGHNGQLHISLISTFPVPGKEGEEREIVTESDWPCPHCLTLAAHVYGGLYQHDFAIGEAYQQRFLPGTE